MAAKSWLCRDDMDRERLLDMERRIGPVRRQAIGLIALALILCGPWLGWWTLLPLVFAGVVFQLAEAKAPRALRPEYVLFAAWTCSELAIAGAVALSGGTTTPTLAWLAIPVVTLSSRFSTRGVTVGVVVAISLLLAVAFGVDAGAVLDNPVLVLAPAALIGATAILSTALMRSDLHFRSENVIGPLTGMLNTFGGDQHVTMSFGVSASARGGRFEYDEVFAQADAALFEAKRLGRDRVCTASERHVLTPA